MTPLTTAVLVSGTTWLAAWIKNNQTGTTTAIPWKVIVAGFILGLFLEFLSMINPRISSTLGTVIFTTALILNGVTVFTYIGKVA